MIGKIKLVLSTVKYLKPVQIRYQILYRLKQVRKFDKYRKAVGSTNIDAFVFARNVPIYKTYLRHSNFSFLNIQFEFEKKIDWGFQKFGKLWNYNLQYAHYILQNDIPKQEKIDLLHSLYGALQRGDLALEPYPVSLRSINVIRFICADEVDDQNILESLYAELSFLSSRLEFHILGNHLLENAFALCLGGSFFSNESWRNRAVEILRRELDEQILSDGAHFELSPMYHNIIFFRLLELIDWYGNYDLRDDDFLMFCRQKASLMRGWLEHMKFQNNDIPLFNDAAKGIAYESSFLIGYAEDLAISRSHCVLGVSGYRSFKNDVYEIKIDFAQLGASYQPGHAHADALSFILYYKDEPLFVEQGTSTYQIGERRNLERSTEAHNTIVVNGENQSEVWGGFRVGRRARTTVHEESSSTYKASHDGYKKYGIIHDRKFILDKRKMQVIDKLSQKGDAMFYLHIHPNRTLSKINECQFSIDGNIVISIEGAAAIGIQDYDYAEEYNQYKSAKRLAVPFSHDLVTTIFFDD